MAERTKRRRPPEEPGRPAPELHVVGIGASAGALAALRDFFSGVPERPGVAFVVVVHLSPERESLLAELLQPHTRLPVRQVEATTAIEADHVYVIPPNANLSAVDTHLRLSPLEPARVERAPIDHFLGTLARHHDGRAVGVILTGTGSDGALGLRHVKAYGGLTIAQEPREAEHPSMPRSAIATGAVDLVLPIREMARQIQWFCSTRPRLAIPDDEALIGEREASLLQGVVDELQSGGEQDFSMYRRSTLLRRIRRRMQVRHVSSLEEYLGELRRRPDEATALAADLLLHVSDFFRESHVYEQLEREVLPRIFERKSGPKDSVRVWTIGCASGEEAYSLAILLCEGAVRREPRPRLKVFASDLSNVTLERARHAVYPEEVATTVPAPWLDRYFVRESSGFRVRPELRDVVVFAPHNVFKDAPYAHLDLVVCRSLLRDLQPDVRRAVLRIFHYALAPEGFLLVGPEDVVDAPELFACSDAKIGLHRRKTGARRLGLPHRPIRGERLFSTEPRFAESAADEYAAIHRRAIDALAPASVLVDAGDQVVHYSSHAGCYLRIPGGELTHDVLELAHEPLRPVLRLALESTRQSGSTWRSEALDVPTAEGVRRVAVRTEPVAPRDRGLTLVLFDEIRPARAGETGSAPLDHAMRLEAELEEARRSVRDFLAREDADPSRQQELVRANELLRSALEEAESAREELQAANEELITLDEENRIRLQELSQLSSDLRHLIEVSDLAMLFLDDRLEVVRFTPAIRQIFHLREGDQGRPISDFRHHLRYDDLAQDLARVLETRDPLDREVEDESGRWYVVRMRPHRAARDRVDGVVLTLVDVTEQKRAEVRLREDDRRKDEFLAVLAHELRNPLAPIASGVEALKVSRNDPHVLETVTGIMDRQIRQLVRLVDDLLDASRLTGGRLRLQRAPVALGEVIRDAVASVRPHVESARHELSIRVADEPMLLDADAARLTQVVANLLHNAIRYTAPGGHIAVSAERDEGGARVTVQDDGIGIAPEQRARIFELFYQDARHFASHPGLGVGLTLARSLAEMHGGRLDVESEGEGRGSTFTLRLPLLQGAPSPEPDAAERARPDPSGRRVLIIDDNADAAQALGLEARALGASDVHTAHDGHDGLVKAAALRPDVVLLDLRMPGMDGFEVARRIRSEPWGGSVLLVALTGWGQEEHRRLAAEAGFDRHLTKPADRAALEAVLGEAPRGAGETDPRARAPVP